MIGKFFEKKIKIAGLISKSLILIYKETSQHIGVLEVQRSLRIA